MKQKRLASFTLEFLKTEVGAGFILALAALLALVLANSMWADSYFAFIGQNIPVQIGDWRYEKSLLGWTKEGLMAFFFFIVGLEIKYEALRGELSDPKKLALPVLAAIGGMAVPALTYVAINWGGDMRGWSVPVATDIAFALAVFAMVGKRLPQALRIFLLTLAIVDDLGAVAIIGVFYNGHLDGGLILWLLGVLALMYSLKFIMRLTETGFFIIYGLLLLLALALGLSAGVSTSLVAVFAAFCVTLDAPEKGEESVLKGIMHELHPYVAYLILPFFAFVATGVSFGSLGLAAFADLRLWGVALGLFLGKTLGVMGAALLSIRLGVAKMPEGATRLQLLGVSILCGIGFTMSLYIAALAFKYAETDALDIVKTGVFMGSLLSIVFGYLILKLSSRLIK